MVAYSSRNNNSSTMRQIELIHKAYKLHAPQLMTIEGVWRVMPTVDRLLVYTNRRVSLSKIPDTVDVDGVKIPVQVVIAEQPTFLS